MAAARARYGTDDDAPKVKVKNDVYTGLLALSLFGMVVSCLLLFLDWWSYASMKPEKPQLQPVPAKAPAEAPAK